MQSLKVSTMSFHQQLRLLAELADAFWSRYIETGPGSLTREDFAPLENAFAEVHIAHEGAAIDPALETATKQLETLLRRCVERPEGLSFVTGEAGLIPRKDLHKQCEDALETIARIAAIEG